MKALLLKLIDEIKDERLIAKLIWYLEGLIAGRW